MNIIKMLQLRNAKRSVESEFTLHWKWRRMSVIKIKCMQTLDKHKPLCILEIPNNILYQWYGKKPSGSLVQALNNITEVVLRESRKTEERLRRRISKTHSMVKKTHKWKRNSILKMTSEYWIFKDEIIPPGELARLCMKESRSLSKYNSNYTTQKQFCLLRAKVMNDKRVMVDQLKRIREMSSPGVFANQGKGLDKVGDRQRRRKTALLQESCKQALWFADSLF